MARKPRKARVEGEKAEALKALEASEADDAAEEARNNDEPLADENGPEPEDLSEAPKLANPVPGDDGDALDRIGASFRERFPEDWENIRLCPLQHGIPAMADILRGRG